MMIVTCSQVVHCQVTADFIPQAVAIERSARANGEGEYLIHAREKNILNAVINDTFARGNEGGGCVVHTREKNHCIFG